MKTIGLPGGMSWENTTSYYTLLNRGIQQRLGGFHSVKIIMISVDFHPLEEAMRQGNWDHCGEILADGAKGVIAGCTEIGMLIKAKETPLPLFDTTPLHVKRAIRAAFGQ